MLLSRMLLPRTVPLRNLTPWNVALRDIDPTIFIPGWGVVGVFLPATNPEIASVSERERVLGRNSSLSWSRLKADAIPSIIRCIMCNLESN